MRLLNNPVTVPGMKIRNINNANIFCIYISCIYLDRVQQVMDLTRAFFSDKQLTR